MNAADYYGLDELRRSCVGFVQCILFYNATFSGQFKFYKMCKLIFRAAGCINVDTVCALLASAERYIQYKCTKSLVQKVKYLFKSCLKG